MLSYEIKGIRYTKNTISFDLEYESSNASDNLSEDLSGLIGMDAYMYMIANQSTLKLMAWGLSGDELKSFMMDQLISESADSWIDYIRSVDLTKGKKAKKTVYHVDRKSDGNWKVNSDDFSGELE